MRVPEDRADQNVQGLEFLVQLKLRGDAPGGVAQAVELVLAVDARDFIQVLLDLPPRPVLGRAAARACRLQVFEQRARPRGEIQTVHKRAVPFYRTLALKQPDGDPGQRDALGVFVGEEDRIIARHPAFERRAVAHHRARVVAREDAVQVPADDALGRVFEIGGVELGSDAAQPSGPDLARDGDGLFRRGAAVDNLLRGRLLDFSH